MVRLMQLTYLFIYQMKVIKYPRTDQYFCLLIPIVQEKESNDKCDLAVVNNFKNVSFIFLFGLVY